MRKSEFKLKPSFQYAVIALFLLIAAFCILFTVSMSAWIRYIAIFVLLAYGYRVLIRNVYLRGHDAIHTLRYAGKHWQLVQQNETLIAELLGSSFVSSWFCVLRFRAVGRVLPISCVVFRDALKPDEYRQLLVILNTR